MKKIFSFWIVILIFINFGLAQTITVAGAGRDAINGVYNFVGWENNSPKFVKDTLIINCGLYTCCSPVWAILDVNNNIYYVNNNYSFLPPQTSWEIEGSEEYLPAPTMSQVSNYIEIPDINLQVSNNSSLNKTVLIFLHSTENVTFTGEENENFVATQKISFQNLPNYLESEVVKLNDTILYLTFGYITKNEIPTYTEEVNLIFDNSAFSNNSSATILQYQINTLYIQYLTETIDIENNINIFYNSNKLNISGISNIRESDFIEIYSLDGKLVYNNLLRNNFELNLTSNQIYVVKILYNNQIIVKKIFIN